MAIDWSTLSALEQALKSHKDFANEGIERLAVILNLNKPMKFEDIQETVRKVPAFNEYLAFRVAREKCEREMSAIIKSPKDILEKIENSVYFDRQRFEEIYRMFRSMSADASMIKWDIAPVFNDLAEKFGFIRYKKDKNSFLYLRTSKGDLARRDLLQGYRAYGILEFCLNKDELFKQTR